MTVQIEKTGKGECVIIPKDILEKARMKVSDSLNLQVVNGMIILSNSNIHKTLEERVAANGGKFETIPPLDWKEPVGSEVW